MIAGMHARPNLDDAIDWLLTCAVQAQRVYVITEARKSLVKWAGKENLRERVVDRICLTANTFLINNPLLDLEDEYEVRRLLELLDEIGEQSLTGMHARRASKSKDGDLADTGREWVDALKVVCARCGSAAGAVDGHGCDGLCVPCFDALWKVWTDRTPVRWADRCNFRDRCPPWEYPWTYMPGRGDRHSCWSSDVNLYKSSLLPEKVK